MTIDGTDSGVIGDAELLAAVRTGDAGSFAQLYDRHAAAALTLARQYTRSAADAEDVVSDSFTAVYSALLSGKGPEAAFRAYLFTVVRRVAAVRRDQGRRAEPTDDVAALEAGTVAMVGADDPALAGFERSVVARAFRSLPERWQLVLWHSEVEGRSAAEIAPLLGLSANSTAALAYRAREGLRQAYLTEHLEQPMPDECRAVADKLGAYVRRGLGARDTRQVEAHLESCSSCAALALELGDVNHGMRGVIAPLVLGIAGLGAAKLLPIGGGLLALPLLVGAGTGAGAGAATGAAAGAGAAGAAGGQAGGAGAGAAGGTAGGTAGSAAGGLTGFLASIPPAVTAGVAAGVVVVAAAVVAISQLAGGSHPAAPAPSVATSSPVAVVAAAAPAPTTASVAASPVPTTAAASPAAGPSTAATPSPSPSATPSPSAPSPAQLVVDLPTDGLALAAGVDDQQLTVGISNVGGQDASDLSADVTLPAGVTLTGVSTSLSGGPGSSVPLAADSWMCAGGSAAGQATCTLGALAAGTRADLTLRVSVDESYDVADGSIGLRILGTGVDVSMPAIPVDVSASPARLALTDAAIPVQLVAGRTRTLTLPLANLGGSATTTARVTVTLPSGVSQTSAVTGSWVCGTGSGTITCVAPVGARSSVPLRLSLATAPGTASTHGALAVTYGPTSRTASSTVGYTLVQPATLDLAVGATDPLDAALALGSTTSVPLTVTNTGDLTSADIGLTVATPVTSAGVATATWAAHPADGAGWHCTATGSTLSCAHAGLAPGASAPLTLALTAVPGRFGSLGTLNAQVSAVDADTSPAQALDLTGTRPVVAVATSATRVLLADRQAGTLEFAVTSTGADASGVVATIRLSRGLAYAADAGPQTPGCTPGDTARDVVCDLGRVVAGTSTQVLVHVQSTGVAVAASTTIAVTADGGVTAKGSASVVASSGGLTPTVSFFGDVDVTQVGAPLLSCGPVQPSACNDSSRNNNGLVMTPLDTDPPTGVARPAKAGSSSSTLTVPAGEQVLWAGLYWSADAPYADDWTTDRTVVRLKGPGGSYQQVDGSVISTYTDNADRRYYQSFADVTDQVRTQGAGRWSVADAAVAARTNPADLNEYAGWALVVVYGTGADSQGDADSASQAVTVYDGAAWSGATTAPPVFDFTADAGSQVTVGVVAWEGDAAGGGDALKLNGSALTPVRWDGSSGATDNAFDSTVAGWGHRDSLGVDVKAFRPATMPTDIGELTATTTGDQYLLGVVTVSSVLPH